MRAEASTTGGGFNHEGTKGTEGGTGSWGRLHFVEALKLQLQRRRMGDEVVSAGCTIPTILCHPDLRVLRAFVVQRLSGLLGLLRCFGMQKTFGYLLGSYRIATAPEANSSRLTSFKSTCFDSPANNVGP
jgi:hypothetical protein